MNSPYLTPKEAAQYMRIESDWGGQRMLRLAREGRLNCLKDGRRVLFQKEDLDAYLFLRGRNGHRMP